MLRWWRRLTAAPRPSAYLYRHLAGTGTGFEIDDLLSGHARDPKYQDVIEAVNEMMARHHDQALDSPPAKTELRRLAMRLASQGR